MALAAIVSVALGGVTSIKTTAYEPCNTVPPLRCDSSQSSTFVEVSFTESVSGLPVASFSKSWTLVAANTVPDRSNGGLDTCTASACTPLSVPLIMNATIVRAVVAYSLSKTNIQIPYGWFVNSLASTGSFNVTQLMNPAQLDNSSFACSGVVAPLSAKNGCAADTAPIISPTLIASQLGHFTDPVMVNATAWLPNSLSGNCKGIICYSCPTQPPGSQFPTVSTLYTSYAFGPRCALWQIQSNSQGTNYELDVGVTLTQSDGTPTGAGIYFTSMSNTGSGGQIDVDGGRVSRTRLSRGWFKSLSTSDQNAKRLNELSSQLDGAGIVVCSADESAQFDQGFFYPWDTSKTNNVPTATGTNTSQSWFYLSPADMKAVMGSSAGQGSGPITNFATRLAAANLTDACAKNLVQQGVYVPGYLANPNATTNSYTPALVISALNEYAVAASVNQATPPPRFLPPGWNPSMPQYYLRSLANDEFQLVYQPVSFSPFEVSGTYVVQVSNDVVLYGNTTKKITVSLVNSICRYNTETQVGELIFQVCNYGTDTTDTTFNFELLSCSDNVVFLNSSVASPPFTVTLTNLAPNTCTYTNVYDIMSAIQPAEATEFVFRSKAPLFGSCAFIVTSSNGSTVLFGSTDTPATIPCFLIQEPFRVIPDVVMPECSFWKVNCEEMVWIWITIVGVALIGIGFIILLIIYCVCSKRMKEQDAQGHMKVD